MRHRAGVMIIGAGIVGCGVAEHLTRMGWRDLVVLDQGPLFEAGGSTSHAPGLVFQTNPSKTMTEFAKYTVKRYSELELDGRTCFHPVGSVEVATTPERWKDLKRKHRLATSWGIYSELISPEAQELMPALRNAGMEQPFNGLFSFTPAKVRSDGGRQVLWSLRRHRRRGGDGQRDCVLSCAEGAAGAWPGAVRHPARDGLLPWPHPHNPPGLPRTPFLRAALEAGI